MFPTGCVEPNKRRIAWSVYLLPMIERDATWRQFDTRRPYLAAENRPATEQVIPVYLCPSTATRDWDRSGDTSADRNGNGRYDPGDWMGAIDYGGMFGAARVEPFMNGVMVWDRPTRIYEIRDGTANTIIVAEDTGRGARMDGQWANGENIFDQFGPINAMQNNEMWSDHSGGVQVLLCDSSVQWLSEQTEMAVINALCTRAGAEPASDF